MPHDNREPDDTVQLSRRKILGGLSTLGAASAIGGAATTALLWDEEKFGNVTDPNVLQAGELDLKVDWQQTYNGEPVNAFPDDDGDGVQDPVRTREEIADDAGLPVDSPSVETAFREQFADIPDDWARPLIELFDVKPGDSGEVTFSLHLFDNPGFIDMIGTLFENAENGRTEPERQHPSENGGDPGELAEEIQATLWYDEDGDNELDPGDSTLLRKRCGEAALGLFDIAEDGTVEDERTINLGIGDDVEPWGLSFNGDGSRTYVTDMHKDAVVEVDADNDEIVDELHANTAPRDTAVANGKLYVANTGKHQISDQGTIYDYTRPEGPGTVQVYDLPSKEIIKSILLVFDDDKADDETDTVDVTRTTGPRLLATDDDGSRVFVALGGANEVAIIDTDTDTVEAKVETEGTDPRDMAVSGDTVLVANFGSHSVSVIDIGSDPPTLDPTVDPNPVPVDQNPWQIIADLPQVAVTSWSGGLKNAGADGDLGSVTVFNLNNPNPSNHQVFTVDSTPDGGPWGLSDCQDVLVVTNDGTDRTLILIIADGVVKIVQEGELPWKVECSPGGGSDRAGVAYGGADIDFREISKEKTVTGETVEWTVTLAGEPQIQEVPHVPAVTPGPDGAYDVPEPIPVDELSQIERVIANGSLADVLGTLNRGDVRLDGDRLTVDRDPYPNSTTQHIGFKWRLPRGTGNHVQTDSVAFDLGFEAEQARNNDPDGELAAAPDDQLVVEVEETTGPRLMATSDDGSRLFVALSGAGELLILDTAADSVESRVDTGGADPRDVAVVGDRVLVPNFESGTVAVIDPSDPATRTNVFDVDDNPWAVDSDGEIVVVANWSGSPGTDGSVWILNRNQVDLDTFDPAALDDDQIGDVDDCDLDADGHHLCRFAIEATDDGGPWGVATCPNRPIYVTNDGTDSTLKIVPGADDPVEVVDEGELPWDAGCSPDGDKVAVAYGGADIAFEETNKQLFRGGVAIECEDVEEGPIEWVVEKRGPVRIKEFDTDGEDGDVGAQQLPGNARVRTGAADLAILDSATGEVRQKVNLGLGDDVEPWGVSWSDDGSRVYVADMHKDSVIEVHAGTGTILREFHANTAPRDTAVAKGKLYVANTGNHDISEKGTSYDYTSPHGPGSISIYDLATGEVVKSVVVLGAGELSDG